MAWGLMHKNIILINIDERLSEMTGKQRNCDGNRMKVRREVYKGKQICNKVSEDA